jgi:hypothetical protein
MLHFGLLVSGQLVAIIKPKELLALFNAKIMQSQLYIAIRFKSITKTDLGDSFQRIDCIYFQFYEKFYMISGK